MINNNFLSVKNILTAFIFSISTICIQAQSIVWDKNYGGSSTEYAYSTRITTDGGYIIAGYTLSSASGDVTGVTTGGSGYADAWVVKLDATGNLVWQKNYGGSVNDAFYSAQQTADGGYIMAGYTASSANGNVAGTSKGLNDIWVVKLDAAGNITWEKNYGGSLHDEANSIQQTSDGGYIIAATSASSANGTFTSATKGGKDIRVLKLNSTGDLEWNKNYGGSADETVTTIIQTAEGGYMLTGSTASSVNGDLVGANKGLTDAWALKLDTTGNITWQKNYGGSGNDVFYSLQQTTDGGYIMAGYTASSANGDVSATSKGGIDLWVVKIDSTGTIAWQKNLGGSGTDFAYSVRLSSDGGPVLTGYTTSSANGDVSRVSKGSNDVWLVKLDSVGTLKWEKNFGGSGMDMGISAEYTSDGGYIVAAYSLSSANGDVSGTSKGGSDFWVFKLGDLSSLSTSSVAHTAINLYPNPAKDFVTLSNIVKGADVSVFDMTGKLLYQTKSTNTNLTINTSAFKNGMYLVKVNGQTSKLLISK